MTRSAYEIKRRELLMASAASLAVAGLGLNSAVKAATGQSLTISAPTNPASLDPMTSRAGTDHVFQWAIYDTLINWDNDTLDPKPGLAKSFSYKDPKTFVLQLNEGIVFHDGEILDANAVKIHLDRLKSDEKSALKAEIGSVERVEVTGPLEVTIHLNREDTVLPLVLTDKAGMVVSPKAIREATGPLDRKPVGAGPWKFVSWSDNESVVLTRHDKYWRKDFPKVDTLTFKIIPELPTGLRSVLAGENMLVYSVPPQQKVLADRNPNVQAVAGPSLSLHMFYFNLAKGPLTDKRVRQALNHAVDREAFARIATAGLGTTAHTVVPTKYWAFAEGLEKLTAYDPDRAKALLKEAGHTELTLTTVAWSDQNAAQRVELVTEMLRKVGIRLVTTTGSIPDTTNWFFIDKRSDMQLSIWTGRPDPWTTYAQLFGGKSFFNAGGVETPGLEAALNEALSGQGRAARKAAFAKIQEIVMGEALCVPLAFETQLVVMNKRVQGYRPNLLGKPKFDDISITG